MSEPLTGGRAVDPRLAPLFEDLGRAELLAGRVLGSPDLAQDAVQEACMRYIRRPPRAPGEPAALRGYFLRAVHGAAVDLERSEAARRARQESREAAPAPFASAEAAAVQREAARAARREMNGLPPDLRVAVCLCCEEGLTQAEAAEVLGVPRKTVADRVGRGLEKLRERLSAAGYAALPAAALAPALGALGVPAPSAALAARVGEMARSAALGPANRTGAAPAAAKGGIAMKIVLGVALAGTLAGGAALFFGPPTAHRLPPTNPASPPAAKGPPKKEHVASTNTYGEIDGPAKEAGDFGSQMGGGGLPVPDTEDNLWAGSNGTRWMRASDGRVLRLAAYEYGTMGFDLKDGPVVGRPVTYVAGGFGWWCGGTTVIGRPDAGGKTDGIYEAIGLEGQLIRIWKNKDKGGRWWFARVAGGGAAAAPKTKGQSADALAVKFGWLNEPQVGLDNKLRFMADNAFYVLEDGKVTCILSPDDYKPATEAMKALPNQGYVGGDGTFYFGYYFSGGKGAYDGSAPAVWRATPDGKVEPCAKNSGGQGVDGDALTQAGWFCGPHLGYYNVGRFVPPNIMFPTAHDEDTIRRYQNGRTSTLCQDGEWRELGPGEFGSKSMERNSTNNLKIGPNGTVYYNVRRWIDQRFYRISGVDFAKPTVNKREGGGK